MFTERKLPRSLAIVATLALYAFMTQSAAARGGGHGGGGHGGGHHASHHSDEHNHHAYHPSHHHEDHHASHHGDHHDDHHQVAHHNHHHENWHHGGWGPGYWGAAGLGYGLGYAYGNWDGYGDGGDTYIDNSTNVTPASNESADDDDSDEADDSSNENTAANGGSDKGFPTDDWPELGVVTYAGEYGASQGQVIMRVVPGSAAEKAGLVSGDVILTFNGKPVPSADDLDEALDAANGKFEVLVWDARTGRKSTLSGALDPGAAPPVNETAAITPVQ